MGKLTLNDFFCGAGGIGLGFQKEGFEIVGAWDWGQLQINHYCENVGDHAKRMDIAKMTWKDVPNAVCWSYGFPCQDLSKAGKMAGLHDGKRSKMFFEVMRLLDEMKINNPSGLPDVIMAENVEQLRKYIPVLVEEYEKRGYKCYYKLFNSKYWGVPQNRKRWIVIGVKSDKPFEFPEEKEEIKIVLNDIRESDEFVDPLLYVDYDEKFPDLIYGGPSDCLIVKQATKKGFDLAFSGDAINVAFPTSTTRREQVMVTEKLKIRYFTIRETARIQGFPDNYKFDCTTSQAQELMGNAVTVNVAQAIAKSIKSHLSG